MEIDDLFPEKLWNRLMAMASPEVKDGFLDLGTFIRKYAENRASQERCDAKEAFERALREWQDDSIKDFLCNWMFEPPLSLEIEEYLPERRRQVFEEIYKRIFEQ